jgi:hypothetical protein
MLNFWLFQKAIVCLLLKSTRENYRTRNIMLVYESLFSYILQPVPRKAFPQKRKIVARFVKSEILSENAIVIEVPSVCLGN